MIRPIEWAYFSAKVQAHMECRYCHERAEWMRGTLNASERWVKRWTALCPKHAGKPEGAPAPWGP